MGSPIVFVKVFQALYQNNSAVIYLPGKMFGPSAIGGGARQGDPSSMFRFIRVVEPVLSLLKSRFPSQPMLTLACADDFCFGFRCLFDVTWSRPSGI
eukprot:4158832-Pyramimonas_sp.AAC.1